MFQGGVTVPVNVRFSCSLLGHFPTHFNLGHRLLLELTYSDLEGNDTECN